MGKKLAIQGHPTRGKEVIELLEMMGGTNPFSNGMVIGNKTTNCYYISENTATKYISWDCIGPEEINEYNIFTLEEFFGAYPFKVGDKVIDKADGCPGIVSEIKWDADVSDVKYCVVFGNGIDFGWFANDSIEFCKEDKNLDETKVESTGFMQLGKTFAVIFNDANYEDEVELQLGDYEIEVRNGKTYAICKKPKYKYPTTYKECCDVLSIPPYYNLRYHTYEHGYSEYATTYELRSLQDKLNTLGKLIICRAAYLKIYGEEMGLDGPWKANFTQGSGIKYTILFANGEVIWNRLECETVTGSRVLSFPTPEMRDAFYENFKHLIEECKELL